MKLDEALDEFDLWMRRSRQGEDRVAATAAASALREYLVDYAAISDSEALRPRDLLDFLLDYYPREEDPDPEVAQILLEVTADLARWLVERDERSLAPYLRVSERLRKDLPRAFEALGLLREHVARLDLSRPHLVEMDEQADGEEEEPEEAQPVGVLDSGLHRIASLDEIDYPEAEVARFRVVETAGDHIFVQSPSREALGEPPAGPLRLPAPAAARLKPGDTLHAEIAPGRAGWELLEIFGIGPGGYTE
jgi:hypothetical protein